VNDLARGDIDDADGVVAEFGDDNRLRIGSIAM
jgi:hypothetical protein